MEIMRLSCTVFELKRVFRRKWPILTHPTCICRPVGGDPVRHDLWRQKIRVMGLSCVILRLAVLIQYRSVSETQTHDDGIYNVFSIALRGKNDTSVAHYNFNTHQLILVIFGTDAAE